MSRTFAIDVTRAAGVAARDIAMRFEKQTHCDARTGALGEIMNAKECKIIEERKKGLIEMIGEVMRERTIVVNSEDCNELKRL